jgi:UDP-N-acetylglucosamine 2-epimerase (non-hydrolysing)
MILLCFGTRPEYIKFKPLIKKMNGSVEYKTLFTGQHKHLLKDVSFDYELEIKEGNNRLDAIFQSVLNSIKFSEFDSVMVQGDTATAYAVALSAFNHQCPVIHLEAGMRTYDKQSPYPEEVYRQCISRIADVHLAPSEYEKNILIDEKCGGDIWVVGNTVLDNLLGQEISHNNNVLVTLHRRENHHLVEDYFKKFSELAEKHPDLNFILPIHPNPNVYKHKELLQGITVIEPLPYDEMINTISTCRFIISDSGGIQEEASFLKKKVIVCRDNTERVLTVNKNCFLCKSPNELEDMVKDIRDDYVVYDECPYGDGHASERIIKIIGEL